MNISRNNVMPAINPAVASMLIDGKKIYVADIPKGKNRPYQTGDGKYWIRVGSTNRVMTKEELSRLFQQSGLFHFDITAVENTSEKDLDFRKLDDYWRTYYGIDFYSLSGEEQEKILINSNTLVAYEHGLASGVGGLLIFGKNPQRYLMHASVVFAVFNGTELSGELLDKKEITGTLPELIDQTVALILMFVPRPSAIEGVKREEKVLISQTVIREAVVNAVCHRDYSMITKRISVYVFSDRVEIKSPGRLPNSITIENIRYGNSAPRNLFLLKYLDNMRYIDGLGRGIPMIIRQMGDRAVFEEMASDFKITLYFQ